MHFRWFLAKHFKFSKKAPIQTYSSGNLKPSSNTDWRISGYYYTSIFYWVQKFNFRCADFYSDHVKTNAFYFCSWFIYSVLKQGKSIIEHRKPILFPIYKKEKVRQKVYIAILKINIIQQKLNTIWCWLCFHVNYWIS